MKKALVLFLFFSLTLIFSCSKTKEQSVSEYEEPAQNKTSATVSPEKGSDKNSSAAKAASKIDYDLSNMNYNMISSITFEMLIEPQKYAGKTIKICGQFYTEVEEEIRYFSVIIWDATLCCPAGMDFIPPATMTFPDDFPPEETQITVTGTLRENPEDGNLLFYADTVEF